MIVNLNRAPIIGTAISIFALSFSLLSGNLIYTVFFIGLTVISAYFSICRKSDKGMEVNNFFINGKYEKMLPSIFFLLLTFGIIIYHTREYDYYRPISLLLLNSSLIVVLFLQSLFSSRKNYFIILQIILASCFLITPIIFLSSSPVGIDPWHHKRFADLIVSFGSIPDIYYSNRPIFQLTFGNLMIVSGLDYITSTAIITTILSVISVLFIYLISFRLFNDKITALESAVILIIGAYFIRNGYWLIPNAFGFVMILPILYLLINNIIEQRVNVKRSFIMVFLIIIGAATHPYPILSLALILFSLAIVIRFNSRTKVSGHLILLFLIASVVSLSWWSFVSNDVQSIGRFINSIIRFDEGLDVSSINIYQYNIRDEFLSSIGLFLPILLSVIGFYHITKLKYDANQKIIAWLFLGLTAIIFITLVLDISFIGTRWLHFSMMLCSIIIAVAFVSFIKVNYKLNKIMFTCIVIFILAFTSINSTICNEDNRDLYISARDANFLTDAQIIGSYYVRDNIQGEMASGWYYGSRASSFGVNSMTVHTINYDELSGKIIMVLPNSTTGLNSLGNADANVVYSSNHLFGASLCAPLNVLL